MSCGAKNELDASFCKKCATSFDASKKKPVAQVVMKTILPGVIVEADETSSRLQPRVKRGIRKHIDLPPIGGVASFPAPTADPSLMTEDSDEDIGGDDGESIDFVPDVTRLEVESIQTDQVKGITFGQLVEEAQREKALRGQI